MKKYLLTSLLLASVISLSACDSNSGLVKNGKAYRDGDLSGINSEVKAEKENKIKSVTEKTKLSMSVKMSAGGQSASVSMTIDGKYVFDIDKKSIDADYKATVKSGSQSETVAFTFKAAANDEGYFTLTTNNETYRYDIEEAFDQEKLVAMYEEASYSIYSWNYSTDQNSVDELLEQLGSNYSEEQEVRNLVNGLRKNLVWNGDPETGTFEVGLGKGFTTTLAGMNFTINKLKASYENGLIKSSISGLSMKGSESGVSYKASETSTTTFSYVMK